MTIDRWLSWLNGSLTGDWYNHLLTGLVTVAVLAIVVSMAAFAAGR